MAKNLRPKDLPRLRRYLLAKQGGECHICKEETDDPVLDHQHTKKIGGTGLIRGVLCRTCNVFLGKIENNCKRYKIPTENLSKILRSIADYLDVDHKQITHPTEVKKKILQRSSYAELKKVYDGRAAFPPFPKTGKLTLGLTALFKFYNIEPTFYTNGKLPKEKKK